MTRKFGDREGRPRRANVKVKRKMMKEQMVAAMAKAKTKAKATAKATGKAKPKIPTGLTRGAIEAIIDELREKEKWSFRERHGKTDFYEYLKDVYSQRHWAKRWANQVAALCDIDVRKDTTPVRIIIDASSAEKDRRKKSRWVIALEYVEIKKVLRENGGPAGCARKMAALKLKKRKREPA